MTLLIFMQMLHGLQMKFEELSVHTFDFIMKYYPFVSFMVQVKNRPSSDSKFWKDYELKLKTFLEIELRFMYLDQWPKNYTYTNPILMCI